MPSVASLRVSWLGFRRLAVIAPRPGRRVVCLGFLAGDLRFFSKSPKPSLSPGDQHAGPIPR